VGIGQEPIAVTLLLQLGGVVVMSTETIQGLLDIWAVCNLGVCSGYVYMPCTAYTRLSRVPDYVD
jgi:hypothetical protein